MATALKSSANGVSKGTKNSKAESEDIVMTTNAANGNSNETNNGNNDNNNNNDENESIASNDTSLSGKNKNQNKKQGNKNKNKKNHGKGQQSQTQQKNNENKTNENDEKESKKDGKEKTSADYYFDSYSHFGIHEEMLKDSVRTQTYQKAIMQNPHLFKDKVVLDIGCGTGILCLFAAKAGAKHVYGIEMASIAFKAREIIEENGYTDKITIIKGKVEEVDLPVDKVDVIISEWMGYFLLYESMLNTVLFARDKWLAKNGILMPDKARIFIAGIEDGEYMEEKIYFWDNVYGFKMTCLKEEAMKEPLVDCVHSKAVITEAAPIFSIDLYKVNVDQLNFQSNFVVKIKSDDYLHAFVAFFDVLFSKCHTRVGFTTAPWAEYTHWKQTVFYLDTPLMVTKNSKLRGSIKVTRNDKNPRDLDIDLKSTYISNKMGSTEQQRVYLMR